MLRKVQLRAALLVLGSTAMLNACAESDGDIAQSNTATRVSALVADFSVAPGTQTINEGGSATIDVGRLCVDGTADVTITVDWADGSPTDSRTFTSANFGTGASCSSPGFKEVCGGDSTATNCGNWTHTYADNGNYTVQFEGKQGTDTTTQAVSVVVNNLAPNVTLLRTGPRFEGVNGAFDLTVEDPGLLATEIAGVTWTWTPASGVNDPTVVNCTCANATDCDDGTDLDICTESNGAESDTKSRIYLDNGTYTLTVVVTDKDGAQTTRSTTTIIDNTAPGNLNVKINNVDVSTDNANPTVLVEGTQYAFAGTLEEPGIDTLTLNWNLGDLTTRTGTGAVIKGATYPNVQNINPADALAFSKRYDNTTGALTNDYTLLFSASDDDGSTGARTTYVRVNDVDPVINSFTANGNQADVSITEGATVTFAVAAVSGAQDPTFDPLTTYDWDIDGNGNGSTLGEYTVVSGCGTSDITCVVTFLDDDPDGSYDVSVDVNDEDSTTTSATRTVTVNNDDVSVGSIPALLGILEAGSTSLTYSFTDAAGALDGAYSVTVDWGDGTANSSASHAVPGTYTIGPHTYADNSLCPNGLCTIDVEVCEAGGVICDSTSTTITITNVNPTPVITAFATLEEGKPFNVAGTFSDPGAANDELYDWVWSGFDSANRVGTSGYAARATALNVTNAGQFEGPDNGVTATQTLTLTVTDADGGSASATATAQVLDNTPIIVDVSQDFVPSAQADEPAIATLDIEVEAETDSDLLTQVRVNWGDPNIADSIVTSVNGVGTAGTTISVTAPSAYIESGTYTATVTVSDEDSSASSTINITVDNVAPTISLVETTPPQPVIVTEGQSLSVRATATDPSTVDAIALNFQVNWDDGATDFAIGSGTGTSGEARAQFSHVYTNPGTYTVNITVTDPDGGTDSSTLTVEVLNRAPSITDVFNTGPVNENTSVSAVLLVSNPGADVLRYSYNFNCTTTTEASVSDSDFSEAKPGTGTSAVRSNIFGDDGSYPVCVRVCDDDGPNFGCDYGLTTVQVDNVAPVITSFPAPAPVQENSTGAVVALTVTASDVGPSDTLSYAFDCDSNGSIDATSNNGTANCTYTTSGSFTASVRVTDGDGGIANGTTVVRVTNAAPTIASATGLSVDEGNATTVTVTASDVGGDALTYRFDFNNDGQFDVQKSTNSATWTYTTDGAKTVGVEVCDSEGACATSTASLTIANVAPELLSVAAPSSVSRGTAVTVIADAIDAGNDALSYQFTIKDSSGATVYSSPVQASNVATATITDSGSYTVDVVVSDVANAPNSVLTDTGSAAFSVTDISVAVNVVANPSTITEGGSTTITVSPSGTGPYLVRYDINGDGDFNDAEDIATGTPCTTCSETGIVYADNRAGNLPYRVLVEVTDTGEGNAVATALVSVTVNNAPPTIANINDIAAAPEQTALSLTINGSDVGANDTITYSLVSGPAGITVNPTSGALTWTPNWTDEGANSITVRATDKDGGAAEETFTVTVTIIDTNGNNISDTRERELNNGNLLPAGADQLDTDNDGVSDLQEVLDGTDPTVSDAPSAPIVLTPNRESVDTLRPTLTVVNAVSPRDLALTYTFVVLDDAGAEVTRISGVAGGNNITSTDVDVDLDEDAVYTWYAFADDGLVSGDDSQIGEFRVNTSNSAPPIPENLTPVDATTLPTGALVALELRAVVDPDGDAVSYEFEVATDAAFTDVVAQSALRSVPFYSIPEALPAGTYFWRGQATDGIDDSGFGASTTFAIEESTFNTAPPTPSIVAPNDTVLATASATLEISAVTDADGDDVQYVFEIADNAAFANAETSGLQDELTYAVTGLAEDTVYFWRARAFDGQAASDWALASFGVNAQNSAPTGLQLLSPAPGALLERAPSGLVWAPAADADGDSLTYTVELATTEDFAEVLYTEDFTSGDSVFEAAPTGVTFDPTLTYFWRVTVTDGTDSEVKTGSFDIYAAPFVDSTTEDTGCGCASVEKPASQQPVALIFGLMMAGLLVIRRRRRA